MYIAQIGLPDHELAKGMSHTAIARPVCSPTASLKTDPDRRKHLTPQEATTLIDAAGRSGRQGARDKLLCVMLYQHGLRVSEGVNLRWSAVDLRAGTLTVKRSKRGRNSTHPLWKNEIGALRRLRKEWPDGDYVFQSERGNPLSDDMARRIIARAGEAAGLPFHVHPHMLRHACGYKLINSGHDCREIQHYLGHKNIQTTVVYTELSANAFDGLFD